LCWHK